MTAELYPALSFDDFLRHQEGSEQTLEFAGHRIYVMPGGTERHDLAAAEMLALLRSGRPAGCVVLGQNRLLRTGLDDATYVPDVFVRCGPAGHDRYETTATLIVEVLSPSTARNDRIEKLAAYRTVPGLLLYLLVDVGAHRIEVLDLRRGAGAWTTHGEGDTVMTPYGDVDVSAYFAAVEEQATPPA